LPAAESIERTKTMSEDVTKVTTTDDAAPCGESEPVTVDSLSARMTAIGSAQTASLTATQSALGNVSVEGGATVSASMVGMLSAGDVTLRQSAVGAVMADGDASVSQAFSPLIVGRRVETSGTVNCLTVAEESSATRSWIGLMAARNATLLEGSRVLIDWRAALILGLVVLGGFGIVAVVVWLAARRVIAAVASVSANLPHLPHLPQMPHIPEWVGKLASMRHAA
jgi:hypothetical protein